MTKRGPRCSVIGCLNYRTTNNKLISFYRLPKNAERCAIWINSIGRSDLMEKLKLRGGEHLHKRHIICSNHFLSKDFKNERELSRGLWPNAVPSVFNNCGPHIDSSATDSTFVRAKNKCRPSKIKGKTEVFSGDVSEVEKLKEVRKNTGISSSRGSRGDKCGSLRSFRPSCHRFDNTVKNNTSGTITSKNSNVVCSLQSLTVDGKEDPKLSTPPVVLLLNSEDNDNSRNDIESPVPKLRTPNILRNSRLRASKRKWNRLADNESPVSKSPLRSTVKKKNQTKMLMSGCPGDDDMKEIELLDRTFETTVKNGDNIVPSKIRKSLKKGVDYKFVDDTGSATQVMAHSLCRICGKYGKGNLTSLFGDICTKNRVPEIISRYLPIKLMKNRKTLPTNICNLCVSSLMDWQSLVNKCHETDKWLHDIFNVTYDEADSDNAGGKSTPYDSECKDVKMTESDKISCNPENADLDHNYCSIVSSTITIDDNEIVEESYHDDNNDGIVCEDVELHTSGPTCTSGTSSITDTAANKCSDTINDFGYLRYRPTRFKSRKLKRLNTVTDNLDVSKGLNDIDNGKRYKIFSLSVTDKSDTVVGDNGDLSERCGDQLKEVKDVNDTRVTEVDSSECVNSTNLNVEIVDEDSRDTLSPPPQPLSPDVLANVDSGKTSNSDDCDNNKNTLSLNKNCIVPRKLLSFESYVTKQGYKVVITLLKNHKEEKSDKAENNNELKQACHTIEGLESIYIKVSKEEKSNYKLVRSYNHSRNSYSRLAIFDCEHCVFYQMTANEFGKHMKLFHPKKPLICPICKHIFKEDYNLIIHLQVTSCGRLDSNENNEDFYDRHKDSMSEANSSENTELSVTIKMPYREYADDLCRDNDKNCSIDSPLVPSVSGSVLNIASIEEKEISDNCRESFKVKTYRYEILIETWKPSTTYVSFEPGIVILDGLKFLSVELTGIIEKEIKKLLKMPILSPFDCTALKAMLNTKVNEVLKTAKVNDKMITIKSVSTSAPGLENSDSPVVKHVIRKFKKSMKSFQSVKKNRLYLKNSTGSSMLLKNVKNVVKKGRPRKEDKETYCDLCDIEFGSSQSLFRHRKINHINRKCRYCDTMFSLRRDLNRHEREHEKNNMLRCEVCDMKFTTKECIEKHNLLKHKIGDYKTCEFCDKRFVSRGSLYSHKKNVHSNEEHLCSHCGQIYRSKSALRIHIQSSHVVQPDVVCNVCNKSFKNRHRLSVHMGSHRQSPKTYFCEICNKTLHSPTGIKHHLRWHAPGLVALCQICGMGSKRSSRVTSHIKEVHWTCVNKPADEQFPCLVCGIMLDDAYSLSQHMMFHSEDDLVKSVYGFDEGKVKCLECETFLNDKKDLAMHKFYIHQDMPFKCYIDDCDMKFWSKAALDSHNKKTHGKCTYECKRCDAFFNSLKTKNDHLRRVHQVNVIRTKSNSISCTCDICGKTFCNAFSLDRHSKVHQHMNQRCTCNICGKYFNFKHSLNKHMLWHRKLISDEEMNEENDGGKVQKQENKKIIENHCNTIMQDAEDVIIEEVVIDGLIDNNDSGDGSDNNDVL